ITDIGKKNIILGYPWLEEADPEINWKKMLNWKKEKDDQTRELLINSLENNTLSKQLDIDIAKENGKEYYPYPKETKLEHLQLDQFAIQEEMNEIFYSPKEIEINLKTTTVNTSIPKQYQKYSSLFDPKKSERFPPKQPYDHEIKTTKDFIPKSFKPYQLSPAETDEMKNFI
ncbi:hypothetical protein P691DRAFT_610612, partial [Macrolepiota fuliginosa MF-IS2]